MNDSHARTLASWIDCTKKKRKQCTLTCSGLQLAKQLDSWEHIVTVNSSTCIQVPRSFSEEKEKKKTLGLEEPTTSHLRCDALPIELSSPLGAGGMQLTWRILPVVVAKQ